MNVGQTPGIQSLSTLPPVLANALPSIGASLEDRFGPAVQFGPSQPESTFVVYTSRGSFSGPALAPAPVTDNPSGIPSISDLVGVNPIQGGVRVSGGSTNVPTQVSYNSQGELVHQTTLFFGGGASNTVTSHFRVLV